MDFSLCNRREFNPSTPNILTPAEPPTCIRQRTDTPRGQDGPHWVLDAFFCCHAPQALTTCQSKLMNNSDREKLMNNSDREKLMTLTFTIAVILTVTFFRHSAQFELDFRLHGAGG